MSNTFATLPVMAGDDVPAGPVDPIFNRLLKDRIIWMGEEVKDDMANRICAQLLMLAAEDPKKDIWLYINSPGGSITAGMAIYDTMQFVQPDVASICMGLGASMGQFLLCAGAPGKRFALPNARMLVHRQVRVAADIGERRQHLLLGDPRLRLGLIGGMSGRIRLALGVDPLGRQVLLTLGLARRIGDGLVG